MLKYGLYVKLYLILYVNTQNVHVNVTAMQEGWSVVCVLYQCEGV